MRKGISHLWQFLSPGPRMLCLHSSSREKKLLSLPPLHEDFLDTSGSIFPRKEQQGAMAEHSMGSPGPAARPLCDHASGARNHCHQDCLLSSVLRAVPRAVYSWSHIALTLWADKEVWRNWATCPRLQSKDQLWQHGGPSLVYGQTHHRSSSFLTTHEFSTLTKSYIPGFVS
jgi:hypothetical protein